MVYPRVVECVPKTQISATGAAWTAGEMIDFSTKFPTDPVSRLFIGMYGDNVTDEATVSEIIDELCDKVYLKSSNYGPLYDLKGIDLFALLKAWQGIPLPFVSGGAADNNERSIWMCIPFGEKFGDETYCFPAMPLGDVTAQITLGTSAHLDGADYAVYAETLPGVTPTGFFTAVTTHYTPTTTGEFIRVRLPGVGRIRGILLYGTTVRTTISKFKLYLDDKLVDIEETDLANKARMHYVARLGSYMGKFAVYEKVPASATDGGPASLPSALEDGYQHMNYNWIDFTPNPDNWLDVEGKKFEIAIEAGDTNAIRIITLAAIPV